jgi:hypothetical protein
VRVLSAAPGGVVSAWQDGGPLDAPEAREVDFDAALATTACGACERKDGWREAPARNADGDRVWRCEAMMRDGKPCGEDSLSESEILERLDDEAERRSP